MAEYVWIEKYNNLAVVAEILNLPDLVDLSDKRLSQVRPTLEQQQLLFREVREGNRAAKEAAFIIYKGFIWGMIKRYGLRADSDLILEGERNLTRIIETFGARERPYLFSTYAWPSIRNTLFRFIRKRNRMKSLDVPVGEGEETLKDFVTEEGLTLEGRSRITKDEFPDYSTEDLIKVLRERGISERNIEMFRLRSLGLRLREIGSKVSPPFTVEGVRQIIKKCIEILRRALAKK